MVCPPATLELHAQLVIDHDAMMCHNDVETAEDVAGELGAPGVYPEPQAKGGRRD